RGYVGQIYAISGWSSLPWLRTLTQPTLILAGSDDPIVPLVNGRILARCIPNATLHVVCDGGHLFVLENPAEIAALVAGFLSPATAVQRRKGRLERRRSRRFPRPRILRCSNTRRNAGRAPRTGLPTRSRRSPAPCSSSISM